MLVLIVCFLNKKIMKKIESHFIQKAFAKQWADQEGFVKPGKQKWTFLEIRFHFFIYEKQAIY